MPTDRCFSSGAPTETGGVRRACSRDRSESRRRVGRLATPPCNGIVRVTWEIRVPESLHPLHELEIIPNNGDAREKVERGVLREKCVLHFAFDQLFDGDGLRF